MSNGQTQVDWYARAMKAESDLARLKSLMDITATQSTFTDIKRIEYWQWMAKEERRERKFAEERRREWILFGIAGWGVVLFIGAVAAYFC